MASVILKSFLGDLSQEVSVVTEIRTLIIIKMTTKVKREEIRKIKIWL